MAVVPDGKKTCFLGFVIVVYLALNSSLNMMNRWALGIYGFRFPIFMTVCHMTFSFVVLCPVMLFTRTYCLHYSTISKCWKGLAVIGTSLAANVAMNNASLTRITLSLNQIIRASIPVVTAALAYWVERRRTSRRELAALIVLAAGCMLAVWQGTVEGDPLGVLLCVVATVSNASMMTFTGKVMSEKIDVLRLTFYTAPVSCIALLPFFVAYEHRELSFYSKEYKTAEIAIILLLSSANALAYNAVHALMISLTSAVTTTVLGMIKIVGLLLLSSALLGEAEIFNLKMIVGAALTLTGFCAYSWLRLAEPPLSPAADQQGIAAGFTNNREAKVQGLPPTAAFYQKVSFFNTTSTATHTNFENLEPIPEDDQMHEPVKLPISIGVDLLDNR